jgi:hypothetical protein
MADAPLSPFFRSGFSVPDDLDSTAGNFTPWFTSRASSLKKPLDGTSKRESAIVRRHRSSFISHKSVDQNDAQHYQPSSEIAATVKAEGTNGARRASEYNRIIKAVVKKWLTTRKNTIDIPEILKRNDSKKSFRTRDIDVPPKPRPNIPISTLIAEALGYSGEPSLSAKKICKHIMESYRWYKDNQHVGWQVSHSQSVMRTCRSFMIDSARVKSSKSCLKTLISKLFLSVAEHGLAIASSGA